ncbi:hypothetical protein BJ546DRAFT_77861 [Cryomyces antarcticus]
MHVMAGESKFDIRWISAVELFLSILNTLRSSKRLVATIQWNGRHADSLSGSASKYYKCSRSRTTSMPAPKHPKITSVSPQLTLLCFSVLSMLGFRVATVAVVFDALRDFLSHVGDFCKQSIGLPTLLFLSAKTYKDTRSLQGSVHCPLTCTH